MSSHMRQCLVIMYNIDLDYWTEEIVADLIATYGEQIIGETGRMFDYLTE